MRTPSGGLHAYFTGSAQRNGHLPAHHLDFRSRGGYVLAPPSRVDGKPYQLIRTVDADGALDWATVTALLEPQRQPRRPQPGPAPGRDLSHLARWVASQAEGNRNAGLFWAANRALDADPAADLSPLAAAARQAGLGEREITRTLDSARKGGRTRTHAPDYQAEAGDQHDRNAPRTPSRRPGPDREEWRPAIRLQLRHDRTRPRDRRAEAFRQMGEYARREVERAAEEADEAWRASRRRCAPQAGPEPEAGQ